jgi:hypothetical protein
MGQRSSVEWHIAEGPADATKTKGEPGNRFPAPLKYSGNKASVVQRRVDQINIDEGGD